MGKGIQGHVGITGMTGMTEMRELERPEQKRSKANGIFPMAQHDIQQQQQQQAVMTPERENHHGLPLVIALNCLEDCRLEVEALSGVAEFRHVGLKRPWQCCCTPLPTFHALRRGDCSHGSLFCV